MTPHEHAETVLLIDSKIGDYEPRYLNVTARTVYLNTANELRNFNSVGFDSEPLADLVVKAQGDYTSEQLYGFGVEYLDVYSADLRRAETMVKTLRKVERGLERIRTELGYPESFPAYLARVAKVLGIKRFGWKVSGGDSLYAANEYRWADADGMAYRVNQIVADFRAPVSERT